MQRRVELAKSLLHSPQVLILDEPSTGLDPGARADLMHTIRELRSRDGTTCLLTTHLMEEAENCDEVAILDQGRVVAAGTPAALTSAVGGEIITIRAKDPAGLAARVRERFGGEARVVDEAVYVERERGHEFVPLLIEAFPGEIDAVTVGRARLEHVFLRLTGHGLAGEDGSGDCRETAS
jgi:ABC-2 type transport system ATP-binding protein